MQGIEFDSSGDYLYVADQLNKKIRMLSFISKNVTTVAGTGLLGQLDGIAINCTSSACDSLLWISWELYQQDRCRNDKSTQDKTVVNVSTPQFHYSCNIVSLFGFCH